MTDSEIETLKGNLNSIITTCLGDPGGDPDRHHMRAAATAFASLVLMGVDPNSIGCRRDLKDTIYGHDFLVEHGL